MSKIGERLIESAKQAIAIVEGKADPASYKIHVPADVDVKAIRKKLSMTQAKFAASFGFPLTTLRDWEQGRARPDTSARSYLRVIERKPDSVLEALNAA